MAKYFLQVDKDLFKLGLNPTEILLLSQIMEFNRTTNDCFMSDDAFGKQFGVSSKTISRALTTLESQGFIKRATKNVQKGKERHITVDLEKIEARLKELAKDKKSVAGSTDSTSDKMTVAERTNCPFSKGQNDLIKDKGKDKWEEEKFFF